MTLLHKTSLSALVATSLLAFAPAHAEQTPPDSPTISAPPNVTSGPNEEAVPARATQPSPNSYRIRSAI